MEAKFEHDLSSVGLNCPDCDSQRLSNFLVSSSLSQKSDDFDLARGWAALRQLTSLGSLAALRNPSNTIPDTLGGRKRLPSEALFNACTRHAPKSDFKTYPRAHA